MRNFIIRPALSILVLMVSCLLVIDLSNPAPAIADDTTTQASPKPPWGEFRVVEEKAPRPWWQQTLLWLPNRIADFFDIFRVDVGVGPSFGGVVRVSRYVQAGYRTMSPASLRVGDFGRDWPVMVEHSNEFGVSPFYVPSKDREVCSAEVGVGADLLIVGAYGGICFDELVDFVGGIFLWDPKKDDYDP